ncbi:hypothetical protein Esti_002944 [Eimeria stiedai]
MHACVACKACLRPQQQQRAAAANQQQVACLCSFMASSVDAVVEEALEILDLQAQQLPEILLFLCRKTTALASRSGFEALEVNGEEAGEAVSLADLAQQVAAEIEACSSNKQHQQQQQKKQQQQQEQQQQRDIRKLVKEVLFGASDDPRDNAEVTAVPPPCSSSGSSSRGSSSSRRSAAVAAAAKTAAAAAEGSRLVEPDVIFDKCPLTQEPFKTPVSQRWSTSATACCHVFEEEALLHQMCDGSLACPFAGCKGVIDRSELRRDVETEEHARRMRLKEASEMQKKDAALAAEAARMGVGLPPA